MFASMDSNKRKCKVMKNIRSQVNIMVWDKVWGRIQIKLRGEISDKINYKVYSQINNKVYIEIREQLVNQVRQNIKL